jgi:hypothetical protein
MGARHKFRTFTHGPRLGAVVMPVPAYTSAASELMGDPRPGRSALDQKRAQAAASDERFRLDWSTIKAAAITEEVGTDADAIEEESSA